jgi:cyclophilin family peptidyl-prolyl cis-trans isomerase
LIARFYSDTSFDMPNPTATFTTTHGVFKAEIFVDRMPITGSNFVKLINDGFYNGLHFHRVIKNFMCQFGCPHSRDPNSGSAGTGDSPYGSIPDEHPAEHKITNARGTLSMANAGPNSGSCQFFINTVANDYLDFFSGGASKHPVFAQITEGMDVVDQIGNAPTAAGDRPNPPVQMVSITVA